MEKVIEEATCPTCDTTWRGEGAEKRLKSHTCYEYVLRGVKEKGIMELSPLLKESYVIPPSAA